MNVESMIDRAMQFCIEKHWIKDQGKIRELIVEGDGWTNSTFRYALAKEICKLLFNKYGEIKACYVYGSSLTNNARTTSDIDIILWVDHKSKKLIGAIEQLDLKISRCYKALLNHKVDKMDGILDIHLVNDIDVKKNRGYGIVVTAIHTPPIKIMERNEKITQ